MLNFVEKWLIYVILLHFTVLARSERSCPINSQLGNVLQEKASLALYPVTPTCPESDKCPVWLLPTKQNQPGERLRAPALPRCTR